MPNATLVKSCTFGYRLGGLANSSWGVQLHGCPGASKVTCGHSCNVWPWQVRDRRGREGHGINKARALKAPVR